jgi:hypothetical protein
MYEDVFYQNLQRQSGLETRTSARRILPKPANSDSSQKPTMTSSPATTTQKKRYLPSKARKQREAIERGVIVPPGPPPPIHSPAGLQRQDHGRPRTRPDFIYPALPTSIPPSVEDQEQKERTKQHTPEVSALVPAMASEMADGGGSETHFRLGPLRTRSLSAKEMMKTPPVFQQPLSKERTLNTYLYDDEKYLKLYEEFGDDFLRLQVMKRDLEDYNRSLATYVTDFLRYLSSIELIMRVSATSYSAYYVTESKWTSFNISMRVTITALLEDHVISSPFIVCCVLSNYRSIS